MMKQLFKRPLISYHASIILLIAVTGFALSQLVDEYIILISILVVAYIILIIMLLHVYDNHIKPIKKTSKTLDELVKGNYRARVRDTATGRIGELNQKVNVLARNLSKFQIQEQLQEEQLSTLIDNTESGLVLIDEKGYIHLVNRKFLTMFDGEAQDYNGYLYYDVLANETIQKTVLDTFLYEKNMTYSFTQGEGTEKTYIEIVGAPIFNERNMLKGAVLLLYDITHLKKLELMRKDFVANVSHELKTPITSITGFAETLINGAKEDPQLRDKFLSIIYDEGSRMQGLVEDLLTLSKLEKDEFKATDETVDMNELIDDVLPAIRHKADEKNIELTAEVDNNITLQIEKERMKQVIINLLVNGISYTPEHGKVALTITEEQGTVHIQVSDSGIGIPEDSIPRIFERFYRVDKARSRNTGGTGLGLAIVKHIVEVNEGSITVESEPDKGSVFHIYLPEDDSALS